MNLKSKIYAATVASFFIFGSATASAQGFSQETAQQGSQGQMQTQSQASSAAESYGQEEAETLVSVSQSLNEIQQNYAEELNQAGSQDEALEVQENARKQMAEAINDEGLSVDEYERLITAYKSDANFASMVQSLTERGG